MSRTLRHAALIAAALLPGTAAAQTVGMNAAVVNDVHMTTNANRTVHKAAVKERVSLGNDILTGKASRLQVLLLDKTNFTVGPGARIKVDRFVYDPARNSSSVGVTVARGAFRFMSGRPAHNAPGQSSITTPVATIGIRGTIVEGVVGPEALAAVNMESDQPFESNDPEQAVLVLLRGPGPAAQGDVQRGGVDVTAAGKSIALDAPGLAVFIGGPGMAPIGPFKLSDCASSMLAWLLGTGGIPGADIDALAAPLDPLGDFFFDGKCVPGGGNGGPVAGPGGC